MATYIAICKRAYVAVSEDDDEVFPGNIAALEKGLEARKAERAQDSTRAKDLWKEAKEILVEESESETGASAQGSVEVSNDFLMDQVGCAGWPGYGG